MRSRPLNILILYVTNQYPMRATLWDQLYSFRRFSTHQCFYLNLTVRQVPWYLKRIKFDLIIFGTLFLATRVVDEWYQDPHKRALPLKSFEGLKIAFPQDEYLCTDVLNDFIEEFGIDRVFSLAPESEWPKIYNRIDQARTKIFKVLAGYLDDTTLARIGRLAQETAERNIDIGYRTFRATPNLGRHGFLRQQIAEVVQELAPKHGLVVDISTRKEDTLWGDAWYQFLLRCKYTVSVEGGASLLDRDGKIKHETEAFLHEHPESSFDQVEAACFPGRDGDLRYFAISPRHLEACATRTCQVLIEGDYDGVLIPGRHYLELKRDFSNIDEILSTLKQDALRSEITETAYRDIVESDRYTYRSYVDTVLQNSVPEIQQPSAEGSRWLTFAVYQWMRASDFLAWIQVALNLYSFGAQARNKARRLLVACFSEEKVASFVRRVKESGK